MTLIKYLIAACALLPLASQAQASPAKLTVVSVKYQLAEQSSDKISDLLLAPVMRALQALPGVSGVRGDATHGTSKIDILFKDGPTRADRVLVENELDRLKLAPGLGVISRTVDLAEESASLR
ncbi:hypothetical protein KY495_08435 [Massilia sp. PAMC28688]|uniref:hypothetical protein n=1 Tax=Massilia sp. PAMC28688 TaxID=2861283 RepID=UPI001C629E36|nr:hypothetical protein [Massilia sp. PAMC28688]QYF95165.1 hypothetical protein KY495_08435 [Massilia sp. PAMC28688]